jgi:ribosomal protein S18 acetylase RimI-like enzyme
MLTIRSFVPADRDALIALWHECGLVRPTNDPGRDIARKERVRPDLLLVGTLGATVVASAMVGYEGHRGWINYLAVAPAHRQRGFGRALLAEAERRLRAEGCPKINLQVRSDNAEALAFYRAVGYAVDPVLSLGRRLEHDGPPSEGAAASSG